MSTPIEFIKPTIDQIPKLLPLWEEQYRLHHSLDDIYYVPWSKTLALKIEEYLTAAINNGAPLLLVAKMGDDFIGFVTYDVGTESYFDTKIIKFGLIVEIIVNAKHRGQGIGEKLIKMVEDSYFKPQGINDMRLQCSQSNPLAHKFYKRLGFEPRQVLLYK